MTTFNPQLLTPPQQEEEVYPYRRVWSSIGIESLILFTVTLLVFVFINLLKIPIPNRIYGIIDSGLALLPVVLWLYFSWWRERAVPQPRVRLLTVAIISALAANAIGVPLINNLLQVDRWLPLSSAVNRIIGYAFTVGIVQQFIQYSVIRYAAWSDHLRVRLDGVAYGAAAGIGYASILNLHAIFPDAPAPDVAAARIFANVTLYFLTGILLGYGLSELRLGSPSLLLPVFTIALGALITGIAIPLRAGLVNASLNLGVSAPRPILGIIFSALLFVVTAFALSFFYDNAERQAHELADNREE